MPRSDDRSRRPARAEFSISASTPKQRLLKVSTPGPYEGSASVGANNCTVALLAGHSALALRSRQFFQGFETILVPLSLALVAGSAGFARYTFRRKLTYEGLTRIDGLAWPVVVFRNRLFASRPRTRIHAPARYNTKEILKSLADLDAVVLRGVEAAEAGSPVPELNVLAEGAAADQIEAELCRRAGNRPDQSL